MLQYMEIRIRKVKFLVKKFVFQFFHSFSKKILGVNFLPKKICVPVFFTVLSRKICVPVFSQFFQENFGGEFFAKKNLCSSFFHRFVKKNLCSSFFTVFPRKFWGWIFCQKNNFLVDVRKKIDKYYVSLPYISTKHKQLYKCIYFLLWKLAMVQSSLHELSTTF